MDQEAIHSFINKIVSGEHTDAKVDFENLIANKLNDAIDAKKAEVAQSIYGQSAGEVQVDTADSAEEKPEEVADAA